MAKHYNYDLGCRFCKSEALRCSDVIEVKTPDKNTREFEVSIFLPGIVESVKIDCVVI